MLTLNIDLADYKVLEIYENSNSVTLVYIYIYMGVFNKDGSMLKWNKISCMWDINVFFYFKALCMSIMYVI